MKIHWYRTLLCALCALACSACTETGGNDTPLKLTLTATPVTIEANGTDEVRFTVMYGEREVTPDAEIHCTTDNSVVAEGRFVTETAGSYTFQAHYKEHTSEKVTITAVEAELPPDQVKQFNRHICVMEFTAQWCSNCPEGYQLLYLITGSQFSDYRDNTHIIALHDNAGGQDNMAEPLQPVQVEIFKAFELQGFPAVLIDLRDGYLLLSDYRQKIEASLEASLNDHSAHCGVAVKSAFNAATGTAEIEASLYSGRSENYRLALYVIEEGIVDTQKDGSITREDYTHHHVAREMLSESWRGDDLGRIPAGREVKRSYTLTADAAWDTAKTSIYALAIGEDGTVNNVAVCELENGATDYDYAEE